MLVNPILPGFYPDPTVCRVGREYYLATSSFEYFPGIPIFRSRDLVHWEQIGHCLTRRSQLDLTGARSSGGIYAPTLRHHEGRFYLVTTDTTTLGNFLVHADDPSGPWSDPLPIAQSGIDPSLFFAGDGRVYFQSNFLWWAPDGVYQCELELATGRCLTAPRFLWRGIGGKFPEAPHLYQRGGWYYLLIAEGGTEFGHMVCVARSRQVDGPFESCPNNPILSHRSTREQIQSTGHGELVEDHTGRWWLFFLGVRHCGYPQVHHLGRETCLAPVTWEEDWPVVNGGRPVTVRLEVDPPDSAPVPAVPVRDDFDGSVLGWPWNFRRNPIEGTWSLARRPGALSLRCGPASLSDGLPLAFVGRRQQHFECRAETCLAFVPAGEWEEAGLTALMNEHHHIDLFATRRDGARAVVFRRCIGSLTVEVMSSPAPGDGPLWLRLVADETWYESFFRGPDTPYRSLGRAETRHLSTEIAGGFTGVFLGLFATANGHDSSNHAEFDWFDYQDTTSQDPAQRGLKSVASKPSRLTAAGPTPA
jgi:alpha-N-arabinofuranosidase